MNEVNEASNEPRAGAAEATAAAEAAAPTTLSLEYAGQTCHKAVNAQETSLAIGAGPLLPSAVAAIDQAAISGLLEVKAEFAGNPTSAMRVSLATLLQSRGYTARDISGLHPTDPFIMLIQWRRPT